MTTQAINGLPSEVLDTLADPERFIETFLWITSEADEHGFSEVVPFKLRKAQRHYVRNRTRRDIILKSRRLGSSSILDGLIYARAAFTRNFSALDVCNDESNTIGRRTNYLLFQERMPAALRPELESDTRKIMSFLNVNSQIRIATAGQNIVGRGDQFHMVRGTEVSRWPKEYIDDNTAGISEAARYGDICYESTPAGRNGFFYEICEGARLNDNEYKLHFYPWWWDERNSLPSGSLFAIEEVRDEFECRDDEWDLMQKHGLTYDQIRWRRSKRRETAMQRHSGLMFKQEYPEDPIECFLALGDTAFSMDEVLWYLSQCEDPRWTEKDKKVRIWRKPIPDGIYVLSADPGTGQVQGGSFSSAIMRNHKDGMHDLSIKCRVPGYEFGKMLASYGAQYNNALIAVERTGGYAQAVLRALRDLDYPHIYRHRTTTHPNAIPLYGWVTSNANRDEMLEKFAEGMETHELQSKDAELFNEALDMVWDGDRRDAPKGKHDDLVMAMSINLMIGGRREHAIMRRRRNNFFMPGT